MKKLLSILMVTLIVMTSVDPINAKRKKVVYLTFDDGPSENTAKILNILDHYHIKATFFVTGHEKECRKYIKQAYEAGHVIGAHTYTHDYTFYASKKAFYKDLDKIERVIEKITGSQTPLIRFAGGSSNTVSRRYKRHIMRILVKDVVKKGYRYFDWNVSSTDAAKRPPSVKTIIKNATLSHNRAYCIVLFHDSANKKNTVKALPKVIQYYKKKGYTFKVLTKSSPGCHHHVNN